MGIEEMTIPVNLVKSRKGGAAIIFIPLLEPQFSSLQDFFV